MLLNSHNNPDITAEIKTRIADHFGNTEMGLIRIARNLFLTDLSDAQIVEHCHNIILATPLDAIKIHGKNYYLSCEKYRAILTINRSSLGIITAKPL